MHRTLIVAYDPGWRGQVIALAGRDPPAVRL